MDLPLDSMMLIKDEDNSAAKWPLARVVKVTPVPDCHVRAVTVRTTNGVYDHPIHKLCLIPIPTSEDQK